MAENGSPGARFSAPFPPEPQPARLAALTFFRPLVRQAPQSLLYRLTFSTSTLTYAPHLPRPQRDLFWLHEPCPKMDFSPSTLRIMARGIYRAVLPTGLRPRLPIHHHPLSSGVYSLFSQMQASSYERTTITGPPCPSSSTLDRTRFP